MKSSLQRLEQPEVARSAGCEMAFTHRLFENLSLVHRLRSLASCGSVLSLCVVHNDQDCGYAYYCCDSRHDERDQSAPLFRRLAPCNLKSVSCNARPDTCDASRPHSGVVPQRSAFAGTWGRPQQCREANQGRGNRHVGTELQQGARSCDRLRVYFVPDLLVAPHSTLLSRVACMIGDRRRGSENCREV